MTRRYFYRDPLAAAWMSKHFGMQVTRTETIRGDGTRGESIMPVPIWIMARDVENQVSERVKYYIHPDSLHLLDPQIDDIVEDNHYEYPRVVDDHQFIATGEPYINLRDAKGLPIVRRNQRPFHWPETEEA